MKKTRVVLGLALLSVLVIIAVPMSGVKAQETLIWEGAVSSKGTPVTTPFSLELGREYRIEARGWFISCHDIFGYVIYAADAQYYTLDFLGTYTYGGDWASYLPAPGGQSFLQIDGMSVDWGPFSNGGINPWEGHEYNSAYMGMGAPITFTIVDLIDPDYLIDPVRADYDYNFCTIYVKIYEGRLVRPGETAFAYGGDYATCFRCMDFDMDGKRDFKNWGWSNGPLGPNYYEFDIWAGAAKCDLSKGTLVGTLTIDYDGSTATVTYMMDAGWTMGFAHLYVGSEPLPRDVYDEYTVSPGQYPYKYYVDGPTHTFPVTGLSGDIYVVAHADVFEV